MQKHKVIKLKTFSEYLLRTRYGGAPDSFQTENLYIVGIESGISRTEVRVLTTVLRRLFFYLEMTIIWLHSDLITAIFVISFVSSFI